MNLAGASIDQRWTAEAQRRIRDSRVDGTRLLAETVARLEPRPALLLASAVGYYGQRGDEELTEQSAAGDGFLADVVRAWEAAADPARAAGARVVHFRQGIVLSKDGGALARMLLAVPSRGRRPRRQRLAVVELDRARRRRRGLRPCARASARGRLQPRGPGCGPKPRTSSTRWGSALHRPTVFPLPGFAVKLAFGEMGEEMLLGGQRALPERLQDAELPVRAPGDRGRAGTRPLAMTWWALLLLAWGLTAALQLGLWLWQRRTGSATVVDAGWAASLAGMAILYAILGEGGLEHRVLVGVTGGLAFGRLTLLLARRVGGEEDPRYRELRRRWRERGERAAPLSRLLPGAGAGRGAPLASAPCRCLQRPRRARVARVGGARRLARRGVRSKRSPTVS